VAAKRKPAGSAAGSKSTGGARKLTARGRVAMVPLRAAGEASVADADWASYFALVHKLLEFAREVGPQMASQHMQIVAANEGALTDLQRFMDIYQ
jgi:hypothetical protein